MISLRLLKLGGASEGVIDIEGCGILSFSFVAEVNEVKQTDRFSIDYFVVQNPTSKYSEEILLLSLPIGNSDYASKLELVVYLQFESVYSGLLNYAAVCSK